MQIDEMCIFMQEGVDRTGSQAYTVSHGKQMTADQSREKGVQTNDGLSFRYDDDVHVHVAPAACASFLVRKIQRVMKTCSGMRGKSRHPAFVWKGSL